MSHETLAEMVGTTRSRICFFMNRFKDSGFIYYKNKSKLLRVHPTLFASAANRFRSWKRAPLALFLPRHIISSLGNTPLRKGLFTKSGHFTHDGVVRLLIPNDLAAVVTEIIGESLPPAANRQAGQRIRPNTPPMTCAQLPW